MPFIDFRLDDSAELPLTARNFIVDENDEVVFFQISRGFLPLFAAVKKREIVSFPSVPETIDERLGICP